jgi:hypothetical protein
MSQRERAAVHDRTRLPGSNLHSSDAGKGNRPFPVSDGIPQTYPAGMTFPTV